MAKKTTWRTYTFMNGNQIFCRKMSATEKFNAERDNGKCISIEIMKI